MHQLQTASLGKVPWWAAMSLRLRVALLMALGIMLTLTLYSALGWRNVNRLLTADLNRDVVQFAGDAASTIEQTGDLNVLKLSFEGYEVHSRALGASGEVYNFTPFPPEFASWTFEDTIQTHGGWRTLAVPVRWQGQPLTLQVALSSPELNMGIRDHRNRMVLGALVFIALGGLTAFGLSLYVLRPLEHLTRVSSRVAASGSLQEEVKVPLTAGREITELALSFNQMLARLREFRSREAAFNRQAAHELRTPLTAMRLSLDAAREGYVPPEETLGVLDQELRRTQRLASSLLILAREGQLAQVEGVNVAALAQRCAQRCGASYQGVDTAWLMGDEALLTRALENLTENAAQHAPGAPVQISVQRRAGSVEITVQDWGPGLSAAELPRLTEEFYRAQERSTGGTGLGLSVVKHVVEAHGGHMQISAVLPHGLQVTLVLPVVER